MTQWVTPWEPSAGEGRVQELFDRTFTAAPLGVWASPGRVNIIGEHVDYNNGPVLPIALPHATYIALSPRSDRQVRLRSAQETQAWEGSLDDVYPGGELASWAAYVVGVAWAIEQAGHTLTGFDAAIDSCVPYGAGLSSSAALECATALALNDAFDLGLDRRDLAAACIRAENDIAGANTGGMDQHASLCAANGHALLFDTGTGEMKQVPFDLPGADLLIIDTQAPHALVDGQYANRRRTCEQAAAHLGVASLRDITDLPAALSALEDDLSRRRVRHVVTEIERTWQAVEAFTQNDLRRAGELMVASHVSLRDDFEVSCPELDLTVETAMAAGAYGARMTGGGFGGSAVALVPHGKFNAIASAVDAAYTTAGFNAPEFLLAPASAAGARVTL